MIYLNCPRCGVSLVATDGAQGTSMPCPRCPADASPLGLFVSAHPDKRSRLAQHPSEPDADLDPDSTQP